MAGFSPGELQGQVGVRRHGQSCDHILVTTLKWYEY